MNRFFYIEKREGRTLKALGGRRYWHVVRSTRNGQLIYQSEMHTTKDARDETVHTVVTDTGWETKEQGWDDTHGAY